jgi:hypothetical protein
MTLLEPDALIKIQRVFDIKLTIARDRSPRAGGRDRHPGRLGRVPRDARARAPKLP